MIRACESLKGEKKLAANAPPMLVEEHDPEITLRVPFFENGQSIRVSRVTPAVSAAAHEKVLGTIQLRQP